MNTPGEIDLFSAMHESLARVAPQTRYTSTYTEIPVIGGKIAVGGNLLRARLDVTRMAAHFEATEEDEIITVVVNDFRKLEDGKPQKLGLVRPVGINSTEILSERLLEGYCLKIHNIESAEDGGFWLRGLLRGSEVDVLEDPEQVSRISRAFATGCMRSLGKVISSRLPDRIKGTTPDTSGILGE